MTRSRRTRLALLLPAIFGLLSATLLSAPSASAMMALEPPPVISLDPVQPPDPSFKAITISEDPLWADAASLQYYSYAVTSDPLATPPVDWTNSADGIVTLDITGFDPTIDWYVMASLTTGRYGSPYTTTWSAPYLVAGPDATTAPLPDPTPTPTPEPTPDPTPPPPAPKLNWVALGDSYSSGEGVEPFIDGTNIGGDQCHRSTLSYSEDIVAANPDKYSLEFRACSGAIIDDLYYPNHSNELETTPQIDWVKPNTDIVTLTIGGNDAHFAEVMAYCATRTQFMQTCEKKWGAKVDKAIAKIQGRLANAVYWIKQKAPNATVYLLGYPRFFPIDPPKTCATGALTFVFGQSDMKWINSEIKKMDTAVSVDAALGGATYVDTYDMVGSTHDLCGSDRWIYRARLPVASSFHPTDRGQLALGDLLSQNLA